MFKSDLAQAPRSWNVLAQRPIKASHVGGQILVNGAEVPTNVFRHVTSFVQDHDIFIGALNVKETLHFASRPAGIPRGGEAEERINALLNFLWLVGLTTSHIGTGISHGQNILFFDEPTSGLDSVASYYVVSYLRQLAKRIGLIVVIDYYTSIGLVNTDFVRHQAAASERERVAELASRWDRSAVCQQNYEAIASARRAPDLTLDAESKPTFAYRDGLAYNLRLAIYAALGLLINAFLVSCGFMSFMAVTYVPAFIEDYRQFRRNGVYDAGSFLLSNLIVGMPFLFLFSVAFSVLFYWLGNCRHSAGAFFTWTTWLYLNLLAAEGVVILSVAMVPNFVGALVWLRTLVPPAQLNAFYKYGFYYRNYQGYVFQDQCHIAGETILDQYGVKAADQGRSIGIVVAIILGYRLAAWVLLMVRH
ncbi:hypothetical protein C8A00DRAFT_47251 [Chaetomidium leptoderma]|uniref:ABC-2 type transporter transmembrane domain-containing protein n=1 Tax=Chaetomidium leptoderma TaxID=669021 RepID=A0AAN6VCX7_9PEZI|nr:hypothetical protein C8A00DRAFT_47251 [Chaetomidium leptoderma]